jgi:hypothetical protein
MRGPLRLGSRQKVTSRPQQTIVGVRGRGPRASAAAVRQRSARGAGTALPGGPGIAGWGRRQAAVSGLPAAQRQVQLAAKVVNVPWSEYQPCTPKLGLWW